MLNQRGGHVLFDFASDGRLVGQQVAEHTIEELSAELGRIDPPVFPAIERIPVDGKLEAIVVRVSPGTTAPLPRSRLSTCRQHDADPFGRGA